MTLIGSFRWLFGYSESDFFHTNFVNHDVLLSNQTNFFVNGEVNKQNCCYYSFETLNWMNPTKERSCLKW